MTKYIDKAALVAEIDKRIKENKVEIERASHKHLEEYFEGYEDALVLFKEKFLDTLEVKKMNSEFLKKHFEETSQKELDKEWKEIEPLNDIGPDVLEYADKIKNNEDN